MNERIVKTRMETGVYHGVKKCAKIIFRKGKMIKGEKLAVFEKNWMRQTQTKMRSTNFLDENTQIKSM